MTRILAIDPGSEISAWLRLEDGTPAAFSIDPNDELLGGLRSGALLGCDTADFVDDVVIEWMQPRGMPTSAQEFETLYWIGRFAEATRAVYWPGTVHRLSRGKVKSHLCGNRAAKDANVRQALIDRFGGIGGKAAAVGRKASPGPLYGIGNDVWQALALAVTFADGVRP